MWGYLVTPHIKHPYMCVMRVEFSFKLSMARGEAAEKSNSAEISFSLRINFITLDRKAHKIIKYKMKIEQAKAGGAEATS